MAREPEILLLGAFALLCLADLRYRVAPGILAVYLAALYLQTGSDPSQAAAVGLPVPLAGAGPGLPGCGSLAAVVAAARLTRPAACHAGDAHRVGSLPALVAGPASAAIGRGEAMPRAGLLAILSRIPASAPSAACRSGREG